MSHSKQRDSSIFCSKEITMKIIYSFLLLSTSISVSAQVTIGSIIKPSKAALLELKTQESDQQNVTSTVGGLILSRVALEDRETLEPFIEPTSENYEVAKHDHTGLFVYNVSNNDKFIPGLYCWDGAKWNILLSAHDPKNLPIHDGDGSERLPEIPNINKALEMPNSYIVESGSVLNFPIMKAYSVWKLQLDNDITLSEHNIEVELLWQDEKELIDQLSLKKGKKNEESIIHVKTTKGKEGNAVVAIKMDGVVRWSWHLWVTDYDPEVAQGQNVCGSIRFMDRYLGATSASYGYVGAIGLLYQWGRKDPFSASASTDIVKEKSHYSLDNQLIETQSVKKVTESINLQSSIINPNTYYSHSTDWYSNSSESNNYLWVNRNGSKGVYDPCPDGWRLPNDNSVWQGLKGKGQHFNKGKGPQWSDYGYYHASGRRDNNGELKSIGSGAYVWSAKNFYDTQANYLGIDDYNTYPEHMTTKVNAQSVRCVKDK